MSRDEEAVAAAYMKLGCGCLILLFWGCVWGGGIYLAYLLVMALIKYLGSH